MFETIFALRGVWETFLADWLTWIYLGFVAVMALVFIKDRAWLKLLSFAGIAIIVGVFIFFGEQLLGTGNGSLTGTAEDFAQNVGGN